MLTTLSHSFDIGCDISELKLKNEVEVDHSGRLMTVRREGCEMPGEANIEGAIKVRGRQQCSQKRGSNGTKRYQSSSALKRNKFFRTEKQ